MINPFAKGTPVLVGDVREMAQQDDDKPVATNSQLRQESILDILRRHFDQYRADHPDETGARLALTYKGMTRPEIIALLPSANYRTVQRDIQVLKDKGFIDQRGHSTTCSYRLRLEDNGELSDPYDLFTAGF